MYYLIDEAENPGKGADCVVSLLHHYLEKYGAHEKDLYLHADNCVGQNKNNCTIQYLMWRVISGLNDSIELSFMLSGHTKFSPDRFFGLFKKAFRRSSVSIITEVAAVVDLSTTTGQNRHQLVRSPDGSTLRPVHTSNSMRIESALMRIRSVHPQSALSETGFEPVRSQTTSVGGFDPVQSRLHMRAITGM